MKKFTMELVWHNCYECPPEEVVNDFLIMTDGTNIFNAFWYRPDGFMVDMNDDWYGIYEDQDKWWWADIRQTVRGESKFKGLIIDDLVGI